MSKKASNQKLSNKTKDSKKSKPINVCNKHIYTDGEIAELQENLLEWYDKEQRKLPWRDIAKEEADVNIRGYAVWVSEIMLQQTQVATVIPYFNKWMKKWPTVQHLASGKLDEVLQAWAGLGYYSRGRRLHEGAKIVVEKLDGNIPQTVTELMKSIPGKTNGTLHRFVNNKPVKKKLPVTIPDIENSCCNFCLPSAVWEQNPVVTAYPCKAEKKSVRDERVNVIVIKDNDKFFVVRRPEKGLLAGLWEFPSVVMADTSADELELNALMKELGLPSNLIASKQHVGEVIHFFSHIHTTYVVDCVAVNKPVKLKTSKREIKWISEDEIKTEAISTAMKKVFALFKKLENSPNQKTASKKRKVSADDSKQKSIKSFFSKS